MFLKKINGIQEEIKTVNRNGKSGFGLRSHLYNQCNVRMGQNAVYLCESKKD